MKHKQPGTSLWNRVLALFMAVFVTVQLAVPAYAETSPEPVEPEVVTEETQQEAPAEPAEEVEETNGESATQADTQASDAEMVSERAEPSAKAAAPADIPGYTRVTSADLENGKYYLIVSQDSKGNLYALYPHQSGTSLSSGDGISHAGTLVADLTVNGSDVTAAWDKDHTPIDMKQLHFTVEKNGNKRAFKGANGLYLSVSGTMLAADPGYFSVTLAGDRYKLKNDDANRVLDFNKAGDENQFVNGSRTYETNFWGPRDSKFPIYLYTKDGESAPVIVTGELRTAIREAESLLGSVDEASRQAIQSAVEQGRALLEKADVKQEEIDAATEAINRAVRNAAPNPEGIAPGAPEPGTTVGQPFAPGTGGSRNFRIPAIITLKHQKDERLNGRVVAAIDARWNHSGDACALDTIVSVSDDNGANWRYNYANFFNDSVNAYERNATAFIDPELVEGQDGTIYMMVDLFPGGVALNTAPRPPQAATGYQEVDGEKRLVLYTTATGQDKTNWSYYVGDFQNGYAPVIAKGDSAKKAVYYVDEYYYLYNADKKPLYCPQQGSTKLVKQNVFFYYADLHVLEATYLWVVKSTDGGNTWHSPVILNPQVRQEVGTSQFYGVGPGAGICTQDGTIMLTAYTHQPEKCSFIYSTDQGETWHRSETVENGGSWSSESALVEIDSKTVRQFYRDGFNNLRYTDHTKGEDGLWHAGQPVTLDVNKTWNNQLSAIRYSQTIDGKPVIMVSTATGERGNRTNGKIYTFVLEQDNSMTLVNTYAVNQGSYAYSSLAELANGDIALLYESNQIRYEVIAKDQVLPDAPSVNKDSLKEAIAQAEALDLNVLAQESAADVTAALEAAVQVRDDADATAEEVKLAEETLRHAILVRAPKAELIAPGAPQSGTTKEQPFQEGVAGVGNHRIPAVITLEDGTLVAAADARWNHHFDGYNIDTMLSVSKDNGATWTYSFPNFFNDSVNEQNKQATAFIDPVLTQGKDGTLYMMVDLMPGGNWTNTLKPLSGYETVDGVRRMVLYTALDGHTHDNYNFYVGDFQDGFAPVIAKGDSAKTPVYYVDEYYYLYSVDKKPLYCQQLGSDKYVQQNVFFTNAVLHTADAIFLWLTTSKDGGATWSAPTILNPQVREEYSDYVFYGVGPGAGICMDDGMVLLPCYDHSPQSASFVYTRDQGKTWHRSPNATDSTGPAKDASSESALVKLDDKTVRQFYRDSVNDLRYTDFTWNSETETWAAGTPVKQPGVVKATQTQLSAIRYSGEINGKPVILVSTATGTKNPRRTNGKIYAFSLESDYSMTHIGTYEVTKPGVTYAYSSLTELQDGSIGLLYESHEKGPAAVTYANIAIEDILQLQHVNVELACGETKTFEAKKSDVVTNSNSDVVDAQIVAEDKQVTVVNGAQGHKGTDASFTGDLTSLSSALFRFVGTNDTGIQITAEAEDGTQVWLSTASIGYPSSATETRATLTENDNGTFYIHTDSSYLYFWRDNKKGKIATFDRVGNPARTPACEFKLYRPAAEGEQGDLPGYVQVTSLAEIQDGGFYLIAASVGKDTYVLYPSTDLDNKHAQSLKADPSANTVTESVAYQDYQLSMTGKAAGTAEVQVGRTLYQVTVAHSAGDEWKHDASGHWHECSCGEKLDHAAHTFGDWTELKAPTETETGLKSHRCTVCGYEETVELPVVPGNPDAPVTPGNPTNPQQSGGAGKPADPNKVPNQSGNPQTGDNSPVLLWSMIAAISGIGLAVVYLSRKKKHSM